MKYKVGDRVVCYTGCHIIKGKIIGIYEPMDHIFIIINSKDQCILVHEKQIRKLIKKKNNKFKKGDRVAAYDGKDRHIGIIFERISNSIDEYWIIFNDGGIGIFDEKYIRKLVKNKIP